jgi:N-methylhydantoinase A
LNRYRLGFDIGGTFTDFVLHDHKTGDLRIWKELTTPHDPAQGVMSGLRKLFENAGVNASQVETAIHGTTLVANILIERTGAKVALLATKGFRDILEIRNEQRYDIYDLFLQFPEPLAPRYLRFGISERVDRDGNVLVEPDESELNAIAEQLRAERVQAIAISFLHTFRNPQNEERVARFIEKALPGVPISVSSQVAPEIREYERTSTTVANAYVQPRLRDYLNRLEGLLQELGYRGRLYLMLSSGGSTSTRTASDFPIRLVESGPAAGAIAASHFGLTANHPNVISFDMGGTTAKLCLIQNGQPALARGLEVARVSRFRKGSGLPLQFPSIDMIEIGAGGGSIAHLDRLGLLKVGPQSAGADPGPACYDLGGDEPTVTDANLLLGYLNPDYFLGGRMKLNLGAAERAIGRVAKPLNLSPVEAAWGIYALVNENMASAAKIHVIEQAQDPRKFALLAYGGGGPIHGAGVAHILNAPEVICPPSAGVASAIGLLIAPLSFELVQSFPARWGGVDLAEVERILAELQSKGKALLAEAGVGEGITVERSADGRFVGQLHELTVPLPSESLRPEHTKQVSEKFIELYHQRYGHLPQIRSLEFLSWRVTVSGPRPPMQVSVGPRASKANAARRGERRAYFGKAGFIATPMYDRYAMAPGMRVNGPAIVEERESTAIVPPDRMLLVDDNLNLVIR